MNRRTFLECLAIMSAATLRGSAQQRRATRLTVQGDRFFINDQPTYRGQHWRGHRVEGLLLNVRLVQAVFDDANPVTRQRWAYPDTGRWDADRNTQEFVDALPELRRHGVLAFGVSLQGGSPAEPGEQPWDNSFCEPDGTLRQPYFQRLARIVERADSLGMVPIVGLFYAGQDQRLRDEQAVIRAVDGVTEWIVQRGYTNVIVEVANQCDSSGFDHAIIRPARVHELLDRIRRTGLLAGVSFTGATVPSPNVVQHSDVLLLHGNTITNPEDIQRLVVATRGVPGYRPMPILITEDDHYGFEQHENNFTVAVENYASWGFYDPGVNNYVDGFQKPPVNWSLNTPRKKAFAALAAEITGSRP